MNKTIFKIIDDRGRLHIPKSLRASLGIEQGDIVSVVTERGTIAVKKAIVMADEHMPPEAKECYVQAAVREFDSKALVELLELIAKLIQELESSK